MWKITRVTQWRLLLARVFLSPFFFFFFSVFFFIYLFFFVREQPQVVRKMSSFPATTAVLRSVTRRDRRHWRRCIDTVHLLWFRLVYARRESIFWVCLRFMGNRLTIVIQLTDTVRFYLKLHVHLLHICTHFAYIYILSHNHEIYYRSFPFFLRHKRHFNDPRCYDLWNEGCVLTENTFDKEKLYGKTKRISIVYDSQKILFYIIEYKTMEEVYVRMIRN